MLQKITKTAPNRYPGIFRTVQSHVSGLHGPDLGGGRLRILSFGCSSGIEILSLRAYFPEATIFGCDVSAEALRMAVRNTRDDACRLFVSTPEAIRQNGPYDLIFAMSVFCQYPASSRVSNLNSIYPFSRYCDLASDLITNLIPGGLFCIINSNYLFRNLPDAGSFIPVRSPLISGNGFIDKFGSDGSRLTTSEGNRYQYAHFVESSDIIDSDLRDCVFKKRTYEENTENFHQEEKFLNTTQPSDLTNVHSLPDSGSDLSKAIREQKITMAKKTDVFRGHGDDEYWLRQEWHKTTIDGKIIGYNPWWTRASSELAGLNNSVRDIQNNDLKKYIHNSKSIISRLRNVFR